jgi:hypothetical protein
VAQADSAIIYGVDNRVEYLNATTEERQWADSVALLVSRNIGCFGAPATCVIPQDPPSMNNPATNDSVVGLCPNERFGPTLLQPLGQMRASNGFCSAFLVGPNLLATAGHCLIGERGTLAEAQAVCDSSAAMFDFKADVYGNAPIGLPRDRLFTCKKVLVAEYSTVGGRDFAVFTVDSVVPGRKPLPIRRTKKKVARDTPVTLVGYPLALPLKVASGAKTFGDFLGTSTWVNIDSFPGNSGGPVFNQTTGVVEGVQSGSYDRADVVFSTNDVGAACMRPFTCAESGCNGKVELATAPRLFAPQVPSISPREFDGGGIATRNGDFQPIAGDFNGDGRADIYWYAPGAAADEIWSFTGKKQYRVIAASSVGTYKTTAGDFDGDGRDDILWHADGGAQDWLSYGRADGGFDDVAVVAPDARVVFSGDFNGDGRSDIYFYTPGAAPDYIWSFGTGRRYTSISKNVRATYVPLAGDFNGDGRDDIYWYRSGADTDSTWWGTATAGVFSSIAHKDQPGAFQPFVGDFDGDGRSDIFWYAPGADADSIWYGNANASFTTKATRVDRTLLPIPGDFDGNSATDVHWYGKNAIADTFWWGRVN